MDPVTDYTPEKTYLAPGIQIIDNILDASEVPGVDTLEGRIGPLILGTESQCHYILMPAGMYTEEHPHSSGSYIYTVRGRWVLCSKGRRHLMSPGTLFTFAPDTPTGYEVPFDEDAFILIFKDKRLSKDERQFIEYLQQLKRQIEEEQAEGHPMRLKDLPADHPARVFARKVNPDFNERK
jgi:quercetin dioxygenase-like cupin family protein